MIRFKAILYRYYIFYNLVFKKSRSYIFVNFVFNNEISENIFQFSLIIIAIYSHIKYL